MAILGGGTVVVFGDGGHAQVLREALKANRVTPIMLKHDSMCTPDLDLPTTLGMGRRSVRRAVVERHPGRYWAKVIHPSAIVSPSARIGEGAQIMAGAIVQANAVIGKHAIINTGAQVDHGCSIGDFAHICPGAVLCADVTVEEGAMVEPGEVVRRGEIVRQYGRSPGEVHDLPAAKELLDMQRTIIRRGLR